MEKETHLYLTFFIWILFLFMWLFTNSVTIAALFLIIWISWRNIVGNIYRNSKQRKKY